MDKPPEIPGLAFRRLLGRGGHGEVWLAEDALTGDQVAVKIGAEKRLLEPELALLGRIDHPHVLRLVRVLPTPEGSAMVLPLAEGGSLAELVARRGPLTVGEVSTVLVPLAAAVEHLHRRGVAHGDLTPGNVLFGADGKPLLGDLGAARIIGLSTHKLWHTPGFTDPAIAMGADPRAVDVWGLGAVGWFALTGRPPVGEGAGTPRGSVGGGPAGYPAGVGADALVRLLRECLAGDPATRPDPTEIARRAWEAAPPAPVRLARAGPVRPTTSPSSLGLSLPGPSLPGPSSPGPSPPPPASTPPAVPISTGGWSFSQQVTTPPAGPTAPPDRAGPPEPAPSRWWSRRFLLAGSGAVVVITVTAAVLRWHGQPGGARSPQASGVPVQTSPPVQTAPVETAPATAPNLTVVLQQLGAARAAAFHAVSLDQLAWADAPGSPAAAADARLIRRLHQAGRRLDGVRFDISRVRPVRPGSGGGDTITVTALVATSGYRQVEVQGGASVVLPARPAQPVTLTLVRLDVGWRVRSIESAA